ncbi:hypothetical protein ABZ729_36700 [Streptomyces sp. NPDC006678]
MKISRSATEQFGRDNALTIDDEVQAGMLAKSAAFAALGKRLPVSCGLIF